MGSVNLWSCRNAGSLSAPLRGSTAAAAWPRIGSASTERPWRSCVSPQSASCSENSAIRPEVSGQTLRCPNCRKTGEARLSATDEYSWDVQVDSIPEGFKVIRLENGLPNFLCVLCDIAAEP